MPSEESEVKIAKLQVEMENVKDILRELSGKMDRFFEEFKSGESKWATREELKQVEAKASRNLWASSAFTAIGSSVVTFLVIQYLTYLGK